MPEYEKIKDDHCCHCGGSGEVGDKICPICHGNGYEEGACCKSDEIETGFANR